MADPAEPPTHEVEPDPTAVGDPFDTAALRSAVVQAWLTSGTRFREDANAEEDHARGYYRDRVVVELAQNAADAAARAGVPGRLTLRLVPPATPGAPGGRWRLVAANTGSPLDAAGVASLASLRASAKSGGPAGDVEVGRFGVGFAAVRSVSDDVAVRSTSGGVRFSLPLTRAALDDATDRGDEDAGRLRAAVAQRGDDVPVLRLPFPAPALGADAPGADGVATVVELELRDDAVDAVRAQLDAVDDALLLALPALDTVVVEPGGHDAARVVRDVGERWDVVRRSGELAPDDVAELPREQRRTTWSVTWALPRAGAAAAGVLHAPTPTDVPLTLPGLLVASFPVDPGRRSVLPGAATDRLVAEAGAVFAELLGVLAERADAGAPGADAPGTGPGAGRGAHVLDAVPVDLPAGELDAAIRDVALEALRGTRLLRGQAPQDSLALAGLPGGDATLVAALAPVVPGLVAVEPRHQAVARLLGATTAPLADIVADLPAGSRPERWYALCQALEPYASDAGVLEALAGARIPLVDGRTSGVRGTVVLPEDDDDPALVAIARTLGVRVVHPDAAHPLLVRAGATPTSARALLDDDGVRALALAAAEALLDGASELPPVDDGPGPTTFVGPVDAGPREVVETAFSLARLALPEGAEGFPFWLGELPLPTTDGELAPARETTVPGSWAAAALEGLAPVTRVALARHGQELLRAVGSHADVVVYRVSDVLTPDVDDPEPEADHGPDDPAGWLAGWADYLRFLAGRVGPGVDVGDVLAVADLDAVTDTGADRDPGDDRDDPADLDDDDPGRDARDRTPGETPSAGTDPGRGVDAERWADVLTRVAADPDARRALLTPVAGAPSYTAWWLRRRLGAPFAAREDVPLLPVVPPALAGLDDEVLRAIGAVDGLGALAPADWPAALDRLPEVGTPVALPVALGVWRGIASLAMRLSPAQRARALDPLPERLPALDASDVVVHRAEDVEVAGTARWAVLGPVLPVPQPEAAAVADLLDLPVVGEDGLPSPDGLGRERELDVRVVELDPRLPATWFEHDRLSVAGSPVPWWVDAEGRAHATDLAGLADALADLLGRPDRAALLATVLAAPERATTLWATTAWG
ncbi:ATP-binding protein [Isoptericola sp. NEAU-Y5]|uniref:ATP-binding protein n=1 Tax=Isoptericola luteus TaxID=2879484 RepID=A0ABS7ZD94_9MICO|nr:ATP-binding protein [Isoptericola sp. NEAU-Y5]MCA5893012.1 ATP-binding protein [Isoptericola sp. NEAU-Y5]